MATVTPLDRAPVGLVPAAGTAERIAPLPCSKEILPIGTQTVTGMHGPRPKVAGQYLLESMRNGGVRKVFIILRKGKWDIPSYFGCGKSIGLNLAYLMMDQPYGAPYTLDQAFAFISSDTILFGFPDILFRPDNAYQVLMKRLAKSGADIVLGLFVANNPHKMDMVELDDSGNVRGIEIKPRHTRLRYTWIIAAWTPEFTNFMHHHLQARQGTIHACAGAGRAELYVGDVIQAALEKGGSVDSVIFEGGDYLDIGTPEDLVKAGAFVNGCSREYR